MKFRLAFSLLALLAIAEAQAASLFVRPTTVILARGESAASVTVTNSGTTPITAQLRLFGWDQQQNQDRLETTTVMVTSPPMVEVPAGGSQTIRLVRVLAEPATTEESYRLIVDEIPSPGDRHTDAGVVVQLRYSIPVFVMPKPSDPANAKVTASLSTGSLVLDIDNRGKSHAQVSNVSLSYADGSSAVVGAGLVGYVLPDKQRQWKLNLPRAEANRGAPRRVQAHINGKELLVAL